MTIGRWGKRVQEILDRAPVEVREPSEAELDRLDQAQVVSEYVEDLEYAEKTAVALSKGLKSQLTTRHSERRREKQLMRSNVDAGGWYEATGQNIAFATTFGVIVDHDPQKHGYKVEVETRTLTGNRYFISQETLYIHTSSTDAYETWIKGVVNLLLDRMEGDDVEDRLKGLGVTQLAHPTLAEPGPDEDEVEQAIDSIRQILDERQDS